MSATRSPAPKPAMTPEWARVDAARHVTQARCVVSAHRPARRLGAVAPRPASRSGRKPGAA